MADTSISPVSNMDSSDTTSTAEQPTIGVDATNPADEAQGGGPQPYVQSQTSGSPVTPATLSTPNAQPGTQDQQPNQKPIDGNEAPSFGPKDGTPPAAPGAPQPPANDPALHTASRFYKFAQVLAGGQRYKTSIDPNTGTMKREPVPLSKSDIGMAIAMEAITGALSGLAQSGPGATGRAAAAGAQTVMQQRQQTDQQQDANANADFARHAQVLETNMKMHQNAVTLGRMGYEQNQNYVGQFSPILDKLQKDHPEVIKGIASYSDLQKYNVTADNAIPYKVVARMNPQTGEQSTDSYGAPQWDVQYAIIDPKYKSDDFLSKEDRDTLTEMGRQGFATNDGKAVDLPQSLPMRLGMALNLKSDATSYRLAKQNVQDYYDSLNKHELGASTPVWSMFGDLNGLASFIEHQEGSDKPGARGERNKNPGNLIADASWHGPTDTSKLAPEQKGVGYRVYNSYEEGHDALVNQLRLDMTRHPNITPEDYFKKYDATNPAAYAEAARKAAGVNPPTQSEGPTTPPVDLAKAVKDDPSLVQALQQFQPLLNATGQNYEKAIGELGQKDPQAAGKILNLYGGSSMVHQYDQNKALLADQAKKRVEGEELLARQKQERADKASENEESYMADAKAIAGDPNDPGSGDMMQLDKLISQRTADRPKVYALAKKLNPNFNPANAELKLNTWKGFAESQGKEYQQVKSFNTLLDHIGGALEASNNFHNTQYGEAINKPINEFKKRFSGDPNLANLITSLQPVKSEFMTFLNNQHALTEHDKSAGDDIMNWNMSPAVLEENLKKFADTAAYRAVEVNNGWKRVFGRDYPDLLSPDAVNTLRKLGPQSAAYKTLQNMQTGGSILGSSDGRGIPGQTISQAVNNRASNTPTIDPRTPQGATPGWDPATGKQLGYRTADGKVVTF